VPSSSLGEGLVSVDTPPNTAEYVVPPSSACSSSLNTFRGDRMRQAQRLLKESAEFRFTVLFLMSVRKGAMAEGTGAPPFPRGPLPALQPCKYMCRHPPPGLLEPIREDVYWSMEKSRELSLT
jgi:hypothetical protein